MSLINLPENFLYQRLPSGLIALDERALIQAVVGGYQDRLEDLRAYAKKFQLFFSPVGLPETGPNVVFVDLQNAGGKVYTRSLDITTDTPTDPAKLTAWAAGQLGVDASTVSNPRFGVDLLRLVDANILDYLATNLGAVLYKSAVAELQPDVITTTGTYTASDVAHQKLIELYFPRLKFKGTARSFDALGKLMGFDDIKMTPLWGRVSPRLPNDPGSPVNDADFSEVPEFYPQQDLGPFYDPLNQTDGPFYSWSGTVSNGTAANNFYDEVVNGFQPFISVATGGGYHGTVTHPFDGTYALAGGSPYLQASVAAGTNVTFTALGQGDAWNGITVQVSSWDTGTLRRLDVSAQMSSIKYRTSYYDLGITMDADKADALFGTVVARTNADIAAAPHAYVSFSGTLFGTSPYRPFAGGTALFHNPAGPDTADFLTPFAGTISTYVERSEAGLTNFQQNFDDLAKAGAGVTQALEEVRAATRTPRQANYGYLQDDALGYAPFNEGDPVAVFVGTGSFYFAGILASPPLPPYTAEVQLLLPSGPVMLGAETNPSDPQSVYYKWVVPGTAAYSGTIAGHIVLAGTGTNNYNFTVQGTFPLAVELATLYLGTIGLNDTPDTSEVVRTNWYGTAYYQARPEDQLDDDLIFETMDEYPYRRDILVGGELVETDFLSYFGTNAAVFAIEDQTMAVLDQTGAEYNVYLINGHGGNQPRFVVQTRPTDGYVPGQRAICFSGTFKDQSQLTANDLQPYPEPGGRTVFSHSELDNVFQSGYQLYHAGLVNGVLVADPDGFGRSHHSLNIAGWLPFNEHPEDILAVNDAVMSNAVQALHGIAPTDRGFDPVVGPYLTIQPSGTILSSAARECLDAVTIACWIKAPQAFSAGTVAALSFGNISLECFSNSASWQAFDTNGVAHSAASATLNGWTFVYVRKDATSITTGSGNLTTAVTEVSNIGLTLASNTGVDILEITGLNQAYQIRDLRIWNSVKSKAEMEKVRSYGPTPTAVPYRIGHILTLNSSDRHGLRVLSNGWLAASNMPAWMRTPKYAKVVRYNGDGEFEGEPYRKEVGLGGGQLPPPVWKLGEQYFAFTAVGTLVAAPQLGAMPGSNAWWEKDTAPGSYIVLSGSTAQGSNAVVTASGSGNNPWPNRMEATNPCRDIIWLPDDNGHVYEVQLQASGVYGAVFVATPGTASNQEQGDAIAFLAVPGTKLGVTGYGSVVQKTYSGTVTTPPLFMYLNEILLENASGANTFLRWTDPTTFGYQVGFPALKDAGQLNFTNTATLRAGNYKLILDVGNVGQPDINFDGFKVDITVADTTFTTTLLPNARGNNLRGTQELDFALDHDVIGSWILTLDWTNPLVDAARGTARQFVVFGYKLLRLETNLYQVSIAGSGTTPALTRIITNNASNYGTIPGGWLLNYSSYGTVMSTAHEGTVYPQNDTLRSRYPLANLLTGRTAERREDVIANGTFVLVDPLDPVVSLFEGGTIVTEAFTTNPGTLAGDLGWTTFGPFASGISTINFLVSTSIPGFDIENTTGLTTINFPNLVSVDPTHIQNGYIFISNNSALTTVTIPVFVPNNGDTYDFSINALSGSTVNGILAQFVADAGYTSGTLNLQGGSNAAPSGAGVANKATLIGRGVHVNTN